MENNKSLVVSLDFDGTLVRTDHYPFFDPTPLPGCLECLGWLEKEIGAKFILLTQRDHTHIASTSFGRAIRINTPPKSGSVLQDAIDWCGKNKIKLWGINENPDQPGWSDSRKVYADLYIDDHSAGITLDAHECVDWVILKQQLYDRYRKQ